MARRDWIRVRVRWYTDPDHAGLTGDALNLGPLLLVLADSDPRWRELGRAELRGPSGAHLTPTDVAVLARWTPTRVAKALRSLVASRTLQQGDDGCYFFPNYAKHQESPSSHRMRRKRHSDGTVTRTVTHDVTGEAEEDQKQKEEEESASPAKRRTTRPPSIDAHNAAQYLYDAIRSHTPAFLADAKPATVEARLCGWAKDIDLGLRLDGMTLDGCKAAIDSAHRGKDDFWHSNLLSGKKLRQHYEKLRIASTRARAANGDDLEDIDFNGIRERMDARWPMTK